MRMRMVPQSSSPVVHTALMHKSRSSRMDSLAHTSEECLFLSVVFGGTIRVYRHAAAYYCIAVNTILFFIPNK